MPLFGPKAPYRRAGCFAMIAMWLAGCASRGDLETLESELRKQELAQEELQLELSRTRDDLKVARNESAALRAQLTENRQVALSPEQADVLFRAEAIKFNMLLTSGQDRDGRPGDDGLSVLLMPVDAHGDLVKLAGQVDLELFDMTLPADRQRLGQWRFPIDQVRDRWHKGFLSAGYLFQVDWQTPPAAEELTLHASLTVPDGRQFHTTTQVKVAPYGRRPPSVLPASNRAAGATAARSRPGNGTVRTSASQPPGRAAASDAPPLVAPRAASATAPQSGSPTRTSDVFTEQTMPTRR